MNEERYKRAIRRVMAAQARGQQRLCYCQHEQITLGLVLTPVSFQAFDICANPACREVVSGPVVLDGPGRPLLRDVDLPHAAIIGDTDGSGLVCSYSSCTVS